MTTSNFDRLLEHITESASSLSAIINYWKDQGVDVSVIESKNGIELQAMVVLSVFRGEGLGTGFMNDLTRYADNVGKRITLTPIGLRGNNGTVSRNNRLIAFYKRFGFTEDENHDMSREPRE